MQLIATIKKMLFTLPEESALKQSVLSLGALIAILLATTPAWALNVNVERDTIAINETLRLEISDNSGEDLDDLDLSGIEQGFNIINRSSQTSFAMINGRTESSETLVLMLAPRSIGSVLIPPLRLGNNSSSPMKITVTKAAPVPDQLNDQSVMIESESDIDTAVVGSQVVYTYRVIYRVQLNNAEIVPLEIDNAEVTPLEDRNYLREINGRKYNVTEKRYAIFFDQPGIQTIPGQALTAILADSRRRSFGFDPFSRGKELRLQSQPLTIDVQAKPSHPGGSAAGEPFIPAKELVLSETWPTGQTEIRVAEPITRSISILAKGLPAELLPAIATQTTPAGLNSYPEKPELLNQQYTDGIAGKRTDTIALVPTRAGKFTLPAIDVTWWNTEQNRWAVARLPAKTIEVLPAAGAQGNSIEQTNDEANSTETPLVSPAPITTAGIDNDTASGLNDADNLWKTSAIVTTTGWLLTGLLCLYLWRRPGRQQSPAVNSTQATGLKQRIKPLLKQLKTACQQNDAADARRVLQQWLNLVDGHPVSRDPALREATSKLDEYLFNTGSQHRNDWQGDTLLATVSKLSNNIEQENRRSSRKTVLAPLYPGSQNT